MKTRVVGILCVAWACHAQGVAPTGTLRAVFLQSNPVQGRIDAKTGAVSGPAADLTCELGKQLGIPVTITGLTNARAVMDSLKNHTSDIGYLAFDPTRAVDVDFSRVYTLSWSSYIVPVNSALRSLADVDRKGIRIGAAEGDSPQLYLTRTLKNAEVKPFANPPAAEVVRMLESHEIDVWGANRQRLIEMAANNNNLRVLDANYSAVQQAIAVAKGNSEALEVLNRFLVAARASGLIRNAIDQAGLTGAVEVAP